MSVLSTAADDPPEPIDAGDETKDRPAPAVPVVLWWIVGVSVVAVIASGLQLWSGQAQRGFFLLTLCFAVCGVGAWIDIATRRIPNVLTYPAVLLGLALNALLPPALHALGADVAVVWLGATGLRDGLLGLGLCAGIGIVSFIARGLGGGDVKLLAAVGAMLGLEAVVAVLFNTLLVAALIGVINWAARGTLLARAQVFAANLLIIAVTRRKMSNVYPFKRTEAPFGVALLIGLTLAQFVALHRVLLAVGW
jgi:prepilin peptidase CpaA